MDGQSEMQVHEIEETIGTKEVCMYSKSTNCINEFWDGHGICSQVNYAFYYKKHILYKEVARNVDKKVDVGLGSFKI